MTEFLLYLYAESPVHAGAADSVDVLDLPVQREASTTYPVIWGQSLKGALRQAARETPGWNGLVTQIFGSEPGDGAADGGTTAGLLAVGDAQLVAMPVPTLRRTFAWVTSEIALGRLARKYAALGGRQVPQVPDVATDRGLAPDEDWTSSPAEVLGPFVVPLGEAPDQRLRGWAALLADDAVGASDPFAPFAAKLRTDLLLTGSGIMPHLLRECTEQAVRVQLGETKTVENGPFYSEYLPAETILAASLTLRLPAGRGAAPEEHEKQRQALRKLLDGQLLQVGGDETLGKGLVWGRLHETETA
ncbi:MAG TPA: type III-B CRISPR module RAMP protein Cmr4 [Streptosporangiaceae bacterium]|nr:type III-B CRISPR module RAMP protein Cmr4 [Streptosporangiaceae bacterium]